MLLGMPESLSSLLGHELLGTTISVLELLVAFAGLFGGGYAGGRAAAISRMRVQDRRTLVDLDLPALRSVLRNMKATPEEVVAAFDKCRSVFDLLPWRDRIVWADFESISSHSLARNVVERRRYVRSLEAESNELKDYVSNNDEVWSDYANMRLHTLAEWIPDGRKVMLEATGDLYRWRIRNVRSEERWRRLDHVELYLRNSLRPALGRSVRLWLRLIGPIFRLTRVVARRAVSGLAATARSVVKRALTAVQPMFAATPSSPDGPT